MNAKKTMSMIKDLNTKRKKAAKLFLTASLALFSLILLLSAASCLQAQTSGLIAGNYSGSRQQFSYADGSPAFADYNLPDNVSENTLAIHITDFTAREFGNTVYLSLHISGETEYSALIFEKSTNGSEFTIVSIQEAYPAPDESFVLSHNAKDTEPGSGRIIYRVVQIKDSGAYLSRPASVTINNNTGPAKGIKKASALNVH
jgi:hypothetical protein